LIEEDFDLANKDKNNEEKGGGKKKDNASNNKENMNIRAAIIHLIGDIIQSIGVVIAAVIIFFYP
jgi:solute carrier family 30 (zinc transporter), member 2